MFPTGFWDSPLWKEAARAGLRQISKMVSQGNISGASRLATTPGVLKPSLAGSQIKTLGQGSEGVASLVAHPEHGVAVRKLYDPRGISGPEMIARKEQAGRALGNNPHFAKFLGAAQTPQGGQMHFNEYVHSGGGFPGANKADLGGMKTMPTPAGGAPALQRNSTQAQDQSIRHTQVQAQKGLAQAGFAGGKDIRSGNMAYDAASGTHKVIDYIPAQKGEFMRMPKRMENVISTTPDAISPWNKNYQQGGSSQGGMLGRLLGGNSKPGIRPQTPASGLGGASTELAKPSQQASTGLARPSQEAATGLARPSPSPSQGMQTNLAKPQQPPSTKPLRPPQTTPPATKPLKPVQPTLNP